MDRSEYLLSDEVSNFVFSLGDVTKSSDVFGVHLVGLMPVEDYERALNVLFFEMDDADVAHLTEESVRRYDVLARSLDTMPRPVCTSLDVGIQLKEIDYTLDEYGNIVSEYVRLEDDRAGRLYDFLLTRGIDADDVVYVSYKQLYVSDVLVMRLVMYWLEEPTDHAYPRGDEREYGFYVESGSSLFSELQDDLYVWLEEQQEWYNRALRG